MTREEFMDMVYSELHSDGDNYRANRIIDAADEYAEKESNWISVSERLPEAKYGESARLLVTKCWKDEENIRVVDEAYFNGSCFCKPTGECISDAKILAWMPLPEPYKGEWA